MLPIRPRGGAAVAAAAEASFLRRLEPNLSVVHGGAAASDLCHLLRRDMVVSDTPDRPADSERGRDCTESITSSEAVSPHLTCCCAASLLAAARSVVVRADVLFLPSSFSTDSFRRRGQAGAPQGRAHVVSVCYFVTPVDLSEMVGSAALLRMNVALLGVSWPVLPIAWQAASFITSRLVGPEFCLNLLHRITDLSSGSPDVLRSGVQASYAGHQESRPLLT